MPGKSLLHGIHKPKPLFVLRIPPCGDYHTVMQNAFVWWECKLCINPSYVACQQIEYDTESELLVMRDALIRTHKLQL